MALMEVLLNQMPSQVYSIYSFEKKIIMMCAIIHIYIYICIYNIYNSSKLPGGFEVASLQRNVGGDRIVRISEASVVFTSQLGRVLCWLHSMHW